MTPLVFVTGNADKVAYLREHFRYPIEHQKLDIPEIQSLDLEKIVTAKALAAYKHVEKPVLVEDTSLTFEAWGKLPGPFIKWFLQSFGNDGLCRLMAQETNRNASATVLFAYYDGQEMRTFLGTTYGTVATTPRGTHGFGWDALFIPEGSNKTRGEVSEEEHPRNWARKQALEKVILFLRQQSIQESTEH